MVEKNEPRQIESPQPIRINNRTIFLTAWNVRRHIDDMPDHARAKVSSMVDAIMTSNNSSFITNFEIYMNKPDADLNDIYRKLMLGNRARQHGRKT